MPNGHAVCVMQKMVDLDSNQLCYGKNWCIIQLMHYSLMHYWHINCTSLFEWSSHLPHHKTCSSCHTHAHLSIFLFKQATWWPPWSSPTLHQQQTTNTHQYYPLPPQHPPNAILASSGFCDHDSWSPIAVSSLPRSWAQTPTTRHAQNGLVGGSLFSLLLLWHEPPFCALYFPNPSMQPLATCHIPLSCLLTWCTCLFQIQNKLLRILTTWNQGSETHVSSTPPQKYKYNLFSV